MGVHEDLVRQFPLRGRLSPPIDLVISWKIFKIGKTASQGGSSFIHLKSNSSPIKPDLSQRAAPHSNTTRPTPGLRGPHLPTPNHHPCPPPPWGPGGPACPGHLPAGEGTRLRTQEHGRPLECCAASERGTDKTQTTARGPRLQLLHSPQQMEALRSRRSSLLLGSLQIFLTFPVFNRSRETV